MESKEANFCLCCCKLRYETFNSTATTIFLFINSLRILIELIISLGIQMDHPVVFPILIVDVLLLVAFTIYIIVYKWSVPFPTYPSIYLSKFSTYCNRIRIKIYRSQTFRNQCLKIWLIFPQNAACFIFWAKTKICPSVNFSKKIKLVGRKVPLVIYSIDLFLILCIFGYLFFHEIAVRATSTGESNSTFLVGIFAIFLICSVLILVWIWLIAYRLFKLGVKGKEGKYIQSYANDFRVSQVEFKVNNGQQQQSLVSFGRERGSPFPTHNPNPNPNIADMNVTPEHSIDLGNSNMGVSSARRM